MAAQNEMIATHVVRGPYDDHGIVCRYRHVAEYQLYRRDYYGKGAQVYLLCRTYCECETGSRVQIDASECGNIDVIRDRIRAIGMQAAI